MKRIGGNRRKTRSKFKKRARDSGKISITKYLQILKVGERVCLKAEPAVQGGLYFRRFHGKQGVITGKQGACYEVKIKDKNSEKMVIVHPVHLKKI